MGEPLTNAAAADAVDKLDKAVGGKFNGTDFDVWYGTAQSVISMQHSCNADILHGRPCTPTIYEKTKGKAGKRKKQST